MSNTGMPWQHFSILVALICTGKLHHVFIRNVYSLEHLFIQGVFVTVIGISVYYYYFIGAFGGGCTVLLVFVG